MSASAKSSTQVYHFELLSKCSVYNYNIFPEAHIQRKLLQSFIIIPYRKRTAQWWPVELSK